MKNQSQRERLADLIDSEPSAIEFMNYCYFEEIREPESKEGLTGRRGIVALANGEFCLMDGRLRSTPKDFFLKIPFNEIEGASNASNQIQIKHDDRLIVLFLFEWTKWVSNSTLNQELYQSLVFADVPTFESEDYYAFSRLHPGYTDNSNPGTVVNPVSKIETMRSNDAERDRQMKQIFGK